MKVLSVLQKSLVRREGPFRNAQFAIRNVYLSLIFETGNEKGCTIEKGTANDYKPSSVHAKIFNRFNRFGSHGKGLRSPKKVDSRSGQAA
jgi:hypothetical protein